MSKRDEQIARMKGLMTYGIGNSTKKTPVTESVEGPDGKIYAVIREGSKYYIKSTPKGSELVVESFDYIGGFMNRKNNEFSSYNQASKNLELKVRSLNESYGVNKTVELLNPEKKESLKIEMTESMKDSLARYRQIMNNAASIMKESATISASNTGVPEAPKTTKFNPTLGEPFNQKAEAELDKDFNVTANNPEKQGEPFGDNQKTEEYKDVQYVPSDSVANQKPTGGKVVKVNENEEYEETIEECDEWGSCSVPSEAGVGEVGDDAPFTIDENIEDYVGFADEDNSIEESEDDLDLDDIDIDLDSIDTESEEDLDLDDIDSEESTEEDAELDTEVEDELDTEVEDEVEYDEIAELRNEIADLRNLINDLLDSEDSEEESNDYELEIDGEDEFDNMNESCHKLNESEWDYKSAMKFELTPKANKRKLSALMDTRMAYSLARVLSDMSQEFGGTQKDKEIINQIKGSLIQAIDCDYQLKAYVDNNYTEDEDWYLLVNALQTFMHQLTPLVHKLSFINAENSKIIGIRLNALEKVADKWYDYYDTNINVDANNSENTENNDDEYEEVDVDVDNIGFEDDNNMSDDEMDAAAWDNASNDDMDDYDGLFDSVKPRHISEATRLNSFGKHPGYRKKVMTLPKTDSKCENGYCDWNDDSVCSEEPFGSKIGDSTPFDKIVNAIMENLKKKI